MIRFRREGLILLLAVAGCEPSGTERTDLRWVQGPAGRLRVTDTGPPSSAGDSGTPLPVVFVHSLAGDGGQWADALARLRGTRRAVAWDLRGHGRSQAPANGDYTVPALARDLAAVMDTLELERAVLVGHSLGGAVIAAYAAGHPERVAGLLFVDPVGDQRVAQDELIQFLFELDREYRATIEEYWSQILQGARPETQTRVLESLRATPAEAVIHALEGLLYFDPVAALSEYGGPTLSIITPLNDSPASLHRRIPGLRTAMVEGTSHWLQMDDPAAFQRILEGFLEEVDAAEQVSSRRR